MKGNVNVKYLKEFGAIILLLVAYCFKWEIQGGTGEQKKAQVTTEVMAYLTSPEGFYVTNKYALEVIRFVMDKFLIDLLVSLMRGESFLDKSEKPSS